jgi:Fur family zinc uptake transcriptional regulator
VVSRHLNATDVAVLDMLTRSHRPLSAYSILEQLDTVRAPVQVYRALQKLEGQGLVHRIKTLNAFVACAEQHHGHNGHNGAHRPGFVICRRCGSVQEFEDRNVQGIAENAAGADFAIDLVTLEVYGHCADCQASH